MKVKRQMIMSELRVHCFGVSLDGFGAGPNQSLDNPLGVGGEGLHRLFFPTRIFQKMQGNPTARREWTMILPNADSTT